MIELVVEKEVDDEDFRVEVEKEVMVVVIGELVVVMMEVVFEIAND